MFSWRPPWTLRESISNTKYQVSALEALRKKLPDLEVPTRSTPKRTRPHRARQLIDDQVQELIEGYKSGATAYELGQRFGIERRTIGARPKRPL